MTDNDTTPESIGEEQDHSPQTPGLDVQLAQELIDKARRSGVSLVGPDGLLAGVTRAVLQTALDTEMTEHLGYEPGDRTAPRGANHRNGHSPKTVRTEVGPVELKVPRDRAGTFVPQIVPKHSRRVEGFDEAIISLYAKGLTTGVYGTSVSRELVSKVTDKVVDELTAWFVVVWSAGQFRTREQGERGVQDWYSAGVLTTCRWPAGASHRTSWGLVQPSAAPVTGSRATAHQELI